LAIRCSNPPACPLLRGGKAADIALADSETALQQKLLNNPPQPPARGAGAGCSRDGQPDVCRRTGSSCAPGPVQAPATNSPAAPRPPGPLGSFRCLRCFCARPVCWADLQDGESQVAPDSSPAALCPPPTPLPSQLSLSAGSQLTTPFGLLPFGALRDHASARDTDESTPSPFGSSGKHADQAAGPASATVL
jgi:hypothetical protein